MYPGDFYEKISKKRLFLEKIAVALGANIDWPSYRHDIGDPINVRMHAATDGGLNYKDFSAFTFYLVRGYSVAYEYSNREYLKRAESLYTDLGILMPSGKSETRLSFYRDIVEAWTAINTINEMDGEGVYLGDGSIISLIAEPVIHRMIKNYASKGINLPKCLEENIDIRQVLEESLKEPLAVRRLLSIDEEAAYNGLEPVSPCEGVDISDYVAYSEYVEKTLLIRELLRRAWEKEIVPIFVSKSSRTTFLYDNKLFSDLYIIYQTDPHKPGFFLNNEKIKYERTIKGHLWSLLEKGTASSLDLLPLELGLMDFYRHLIVFRFYARLHRDSPVLKIEVAFNPVESRKLVETFLEEDFEALASSITRRLLGLPLEDGYPIILRNVHERSKISPRELEIVYTSLGLGIRRGAREVLGE